MKRNILIGLMIPALLLASCSGQTPTNDGGMQSHADTSSRAEIVDPPETADPSVFDLSLPQSAVPGTVADPSGSVAITLNGASASCSSDAVDISGGTVTIREAGSYIVSGTLEDGMIVVNADKEDKVEIILNGAAVTSLTSAPIYVIQADKVTLTLAKDSVNILANGGSFSAIDENNIDAVIFSKEDLTLAGSGTLSIASPAGHGIVSKDDLKVKAGVYEISAASHGMTANDRIEIEDGTLLITAGKDGIQADNTKDTTLGNITVTAGNLKISADGDGISASGTLTVSGGVLDITCGGGRAKAAYGTDVSAKGLKCVSDMVLSGGIFSLITADDAVHSNANITVSGGSYTIESGDDGMHADGNLTVQDGNITITGCYEGLEGESVDIMGGTIRLKSDDDGINAAGGADQSGMGGFRGGDKFGRGGGVSSAQTSSYIHISGGITIICTEGDGVDSNGSLAVSGGELYISGPSNSMNASLDYETDAVITGGVVVAAGAAGMAQNFGSSSQQCSILITTGSQPAGAAISIADSTGTVLAEYTAESAFGSLVISCPALAVGSQYTVTAGDFVQTITLSTQIYSAGGASVPGSRGGMGEMPTPGDKGNMGEMPTPGDRGNMGEMPAPDDKGNMGEMPAPGDRGNMGEMPAPGDRGNMGGDVQ